MNSQSEPPSSNNNISNVFVRSFIRLFVTPVIAALVLLLFAILPAQALNAPVITPGTGSFDTPQTVSITGPSGSSISFTVNGDTPTTSSTAYSSPLTISHTTQINAIAWQSGTYSPVTTAFLDVDPALVPVVRNVPQTFTIGGSIHAGDVVSVSVFDTNIPAAPGQSAGQRTYTHTVTGGDSFSNIANQLYTQFAGDTALASAGIASSWTSGAPYFVISSGTGHTTYSDSVSTGATATITQHSALILRLSSQFGVQKSAGSPGPILQWSDLSGVGNDASAAYGTQPTLVNSPMGFPVVNFDGVSQHLSLPSGFAYFTGLNIFAVIAPSTLSANARILDLGQGSSGNDVALQIDSTATYGAYASYSGTSPSSATTSPTALAPTQYQLLAPSQLSSTARTYLNGAGGSTNSSMYSPAGVTRNSNFIGQASSGGSYFSGNIIELLVFTASLSESQRAAVEAYLITKLQLLSAVPAPPVISEPSGTLQQPIQVVISTQPGTVTYYTRDGSTPGPSSTANRGCPIDINYSQTIKAVAFKNGVSSSISSASYTLDSTQWPAPDPGDTTAPSINLQLPVPSL